MALRLNCDLGESFGAWTMGLDDEVMPFIDQANIACGFHAGDPVVMKKTLLKSWLAQVATDNSACSCETPTLAKTTVLNST